MRFTSRGRRALAIGVVASALALTGCTSSGGSDSGGPVTLTLWYNSADTAAEKAIYSAYEKESGNTIKLVSIPAAGFEDALLTKWATGARPDLVEWHPEKGFLASLNPAQNLQPLDGMAYIKQSGDYYDSIGSWDGKVYAAVLNTPGMFGMYYNRAALSNAGVEAPKTYADLVEVCKAVKAKTPGVAPIYQAGADQWPLTALPFNLWGGSFDYAEKIAYNKAKFDGPGSPFPVALQKFKDLQDMGCFNTDAKTGTVTAGFAAVASGKAAIVFQSTDQLTSLQAAAGSAAKSDATIGWGSVGTTEPYANYTPGPNGTYMAPKTNNPAQEAAAKDFIKFATGKYYQTYVDQAKINPLIKAPGITAPTGVSELQQSINTFYDKSPKQPLFNVDIAGFGNFVQLMPQLLAGQLTPTTLSAKLQAIVQQASVAAKVKGW